MRTIAKMMTPLRLLLGGAEKEVARPEPLPQGVELELGFPHGYNVYGITGGPEGDSQIMVGAGNPETSEGAVFLGIPSGSWKQVTLPDETALLSCFLRLSNGKYLAGGMSSIGRGALLLGNEAGTSWESADVDLHPYSAIESLVELPGGDVLASTGHMVTQGKTKPVIFRSPDQGKTWQKEDYDLPITMFRSFQFSSGGDLYAGTCGDHTPVMYKSADGAKTWTPLPEFPAYKTFKMPVIKFVEMGGIERLFVMMWGYKTELADRVVRLYLLSEDGTNWEELPEIDNSHYVFSFIASKDGTFYVGSEKGKVYRSKDFGRTWEIITEFSTNIGAYALHEDASGRVWIGKDYVSPDQYSLWKI